MEDEAFWEALSTGRLALPPWEVLQDPHQQRRTAAHRLKGDVDLCVDAICALCTWLLRHPDTRGERWADTPLRPRAGWERPKKDLFNEVCALAIDIGRHLPLSSNNYHALTPTTVRDALGFTGELADLIHTEISRAVQARKARMMLPTRAQRAAHALDFNPAAVL